MSTTTNFKRIALVAVAALGLGVLSSVPSNAAITGVITVTDSGTTTATTSLADSTTAGTLGVRWLATTAGDTVGVTTALNTQPSGGGSPSLNFYPKDTSTSISNSTMAVFTGATRTVAADAQDTATVTTGSGVGYTAGNFLYQLDATPAKAGTYTYTLTFTPYTGNVAETSKVVTKDVSIVVTAPASASLVAAPAYSTAKLVSGTTVDSSTAESTSVSLLATASPTASASVWVKLVNAAGVATATEDSLTVTIDKGNIGTTTSAASGKNVIIDYKPAVENGGLAFYVFPDGSTGSATITIATKNAGSFTKTLTWYSATYATITAAVYRSVIAVGTESSLGAVSATAADASGSSYGSAITVYAYSSDTSVISNNGTACTYDSTTKAAMCPLTGVKAGTANITIRDKSTVALSKATSNAVAVRVSQGVATSFTLKTDKATYAPGEKGYLWVSVLDAAGLAMPVQTDAVILASGGITSSVVTGSTSDTTTATTFSTERSATPASNDPVKVYTFYAPVTGGPIVFSAKGAAGLSAASIATATTVTATVTDSGAAALAAVTALATTVASLRTLIVTLTNLVLKIQKKVRA
jgi:hypothetical protein